MVFSQQKIGAIFFVIGIFILGSFFGSIYTKNIYENKNNTTRTSSINDIIKLPLNTLSSQGEEILRSEKVKKAYEIIEKNYYHFYEKNTSDIENGIIEGMVSGLKDKHSEFMPPKVAQDFEEALNGDFEGIGAVIEEAPGGIRISRVLDNSPAQRTGLKENDLMLKVGETSLEGMKTTEAVRLIKGPKGSTVVISYIEAKTKLPKTISIIRDTVIIPSVSEKILTGTTEKIGYIEVGIFGDNTEKEFSNALTHLSGSGVDGIILDFRFNGGGFLDTAQTLLSHFFPENTPLVITKENDIKKTKTLFSKGNGNTKIPLVMLINNMSASASEITAGAFQDHARAVIVGQKSYGKGSIQQPFNFSDGSILKITIGRWYTPKDHSIDGNGITPDIGIEFQKEDYEKKHDRQLEGAKKILQTLIQESGNVEKTIEKFKGYTF